MRASHLRSRTEPHRPEERSSLPKSRASRLTSLVSLLNRDLELATSSNTNPRIFPYSVKQQCWDKAEKIRGRDSLGNTVFRKLVGCPGCLCHDYDHIVPYSKGGQSSLDNCQVLQATVDRSKGNRTEFSRGSFRKAPTVGFQVVTWILLNCQLMAMFVAHKILDDVESSNNLFFCNLLYNVF
ncbi:hypothetical protein ACE6H2_023409 [Prunus campanulata]